MTVGRRKGEAEEAGEAGEEVEEAGDKTSPLLLFWERDDQ
jgi:hypothetical protein